MPDEVMPQAREGFKCERCNLTFVSRKELEEHMRQHERAAQIFRCEKCKMNFNTQEEMEKHIREIHLKK
ncbi:MAG: C2H2-type zinc finger protein [Candidatus Bathyarchaeota archaeon]|nr:C2H2-type zinc finger protein [Candidatus Bathyarchaeota archaeon]